MNLGELITKLAKLDPDLEIRLSNGDHAGKFSSYRGFYHHLALENGEGYTEGFEEQGYIKHKTVGHLLATAGAAVGKTFSGYKGGDYVMDHETPLWISKWGDSSGLALMDVTVVTGGNGSQLRAVILGANIDEYLF